MGQKVTLLQSVFNKGELSPRLRGRVDNAQYYKAYDEGDNFLPFPEGSGTFRPGTVFVNEVKDSANVTIVRPFKFSTVQNYVIEFGDQYVRFYRNRGLVETSPGSGVAYEISTPYVTADLRSLSFTQSADVLYIAHPDYQTRKLTRTSDTSWTLDAIEFVDGPYLPINSTSTTITPSGTSGTVTLTASSNIFEVGDVGRQMRIRVSTGTWTYGEITAFSSATSVTFRIDGPALSGTSATTSWRFGAFGGNRGWPAVVTIFEERLLLARTIDLPSSVFGSRTGDFENFGPSFLDDGTVRDDDGFVYTISDDQVNSINWMSAGRTVIIGTTGGEYSLTGGTASTFAPITPSNVTIRRETNFGSKADIRVYRIGSAIIYPSQSAKKAREINYEFGIDSYVSRDLTLFSEQILKAGIVDMEYAQEPDPYVWICDGNGGLKGIVYERIQEIEGWHSHTISGTDAKVEALAVIPRPADENDDVWMVVSRTIDGQTRRYIEYLSEIFEDAEAPFANAPDRSYAKFLDSCLTYDGFLSGDLTPSATTGTGVTFVSGDNQFTANDVGKQIRSGLSRATITNFNSTSNVTADITVDFESVDPIAQGDWCLADTTFSGLDHLEGEIVGVQVDGAVTDDQVVSGGSIEIDNPACVVHVGLKYNLRLLLLPDAGLQSGIILQGREKSISVIHFYLTDTYGMAVKGLDVGITDTTKFLNFPIIADQTPPLTTGLVSVHPPSGYERDDQIEIQHNIAMPFTLNYVVKELDVES